IAQRSSAAQRSEAAQRSGDGPFDLDDETAGRINHARGGGQSLDGGMQERMSAATGHDFSDVRVHTGPEANELNHDLGAKA
ncbi:eCIS core domain-containing protein, partial [Halalkalibacter lacteus]|uniref:eCIS core domain-containing protein n=1 Tax=Halalkalibacter lacteus TaxID=3090663 RepID=UPI002FC6059A